RGRGRRWGWTAAAYTVASVVGGALAGALAGGIGALVMMAGGRGTAAPSGAGWLAAAVVLTAAALDTGHVPLPSIHRRVNEDWLVRYRGWVYGSGFGFQLGLGFATFVPSAAVYAVWGLAGLSGSIAGGGLIGAAFGFTRAVPVLAAGWVRTPARLR